MNFFHCLVSVKHLNHCVYSLSTNYHIYTKLSDEHIPPPPHFTTYSTYSVELCDNSGNAVSNVNLFQLTGCRSDQAEGSKQYAAVCYSSMGNNKDMLDKTPTCKLLISPNVLFAQRFDQKIFIRLTRTFGSKRCTIKLREQSTVYRYLSSVYFL